jgi:colanic acid/amylovoran biosynthesis glycosyltransferase
MRVAFFVDAFPVLSETFIVNQITGLLDRGLDVDVFARGRRRYDTMHHVIVRYGLIERTTYLDSDTTNKAARVAAAFRELAHSRAGFRPRRLARLARAVTARGRVPPFNTLALLRMVARELRGDCYDVIHAQYGPLGRALVEARERGIVHGKLVTSFRGHDVTQHARATVEYYRDLFRHGDLFLPVSRALEQRLHALGCPPGRTEVLHSGIDLAQFAFQPRRASADGVVRIVTIARLVEMKGVQYGIEAVSALRRRGYRVRYEIAGDGPLRTELTQLVDSLGERSNIHLLGWRSHEQLNGLLAGAHIMLAPSVTAANGETEGIPNAVKEAMAMGLPIVATRHGGTPELVDDGVSGLLADERDSVGLSERLAYLCDHPEQWPAMGEAGRRKVQAEFDMEALNDRLVALYRG